MSRDRRAALCQPASIVSVENKAAAELPHSRLDVSRVYLEVVDDVYAVNLQGHNSLVK